MTLPYYPFYWSDYSGKTFNLSLIEHGVYFLLLRHIYTEGGPIPHEDRFSIAKALIEPHHKIVDKILATYFVKKGEFWHNERAEEVMIGADDKHEKRRNAGSLGGKTKASNAKNLLVAKPKQTRSNQNQNQNKTPNPLPGAGGEVLTEGFGGRVKPVGGKFDILLHLSDDGREKARANAPGWDIHHLARIYNQKVAEGSFFEPERPDPAFAAWVGAYTKGKPP